jgi:hypothetical protein
MEILPNSLYLEISKYLLGEECESLAIYTSDYYIKILLEGRTFKSCTLKNYTLHSFDDLPAILHTNDTIEYFKYNKRHRLDAPAVIFTSGTIVYYYNGEYHNDDGPAIIDDSGYRSWYIYDNYIKEEF